MFEIGVLVMVSAAAVVLVGRQIYLWRVKRFLADPFVNCIPLPRVDDHNWIVCKTTKWPGKDRQTARETLRCGAYDIDYADDSEEIRLDGSVIASKGAYCAAVIEAYEYRNEKQTLASSTLS